MKVYNEKSPCKDCPNRQVGCHNKCEKYIEWSNSAIEKPIQTYYSTYEKRTDDIYPKWHKKSYKNKRGNK